MKKESKAVREARRLAKVLARQSGRPYSQHLDEIARKAGHGTWSSFQQADGVAKDAMEPQIEPTGVNRYPTDTKCIPAALPSAFEQQGLKGLPAFQAFSKECSLLLERIEDVAILPYPVEWLLDWTIEQGRTAESLTRKDPETGFILADPGSANPAALERLALIIHDLESADIPGREIIPVALLHDQVEEWAAAGDRVRFLSEVANVLARTMTSQLQNVGMLAHLPKHGLAATRQHFHDILSDTFEIPRVPTYEPPLEAMPIEQAIKLVQDDTINQAMIEAKIEDGDAITLDFLQAVAMNSIINEFGMPEPPSLPPEWLAA